MEAVFCSDAHMQAILSLSDGADGQSHKRAGRLTFLRSNLLMDRKVVPPERKRWSWGSNALCAVKVLRMALESASDSCTAGCSTCGRMPRAVRREKACPKISAPSQTTVDKKPSQLLEHKHVCAVAYHPLVIDTLQCVAGRYTCCNPNSSGQN